MRLRLEARGWKGGRKILVFQNISDFLVVGRKQVRDKQDGHQSRRNSMLQILDLYYVTQLRGMHHNITLDGRISLLPNFNQQDLSACIA